MNKNFTPNANGALQEKLIQLLGKSKCTNNQKPNTRTRKNVFALKNLNEIGDDGVDHINISDCGVTPLGQLLSFSNNLRFTSKVLGPFMNINALWNYVTIKDCPKSIRNMNSTEVRHLLKESKTQYVDNLPGIINTAMYERINQWPDIKQAIIESELPFDLYYYKKDVPTDEKVRCRSTVANWVVKGLEDIRFALKNNCEPTFKLYYGKMPEYNAKTKKRNKAIQLSVDTALALNVSEEHKMQIEHGKKDLENESALVTNGAGEVSIEVSFLRNTVDNNEITIPPSTVFWCS